MERRDPELYIISKYKGIGHGIKDIQGGCNQLSLLGEHVTKMALVCEALPFGYVCVLDVNPPRRKKSYKYSNH